MKLDLLIAQILSGVYGPFHYDVWSFQFDMWLEWCIERDGVQYTKDDILWYKVINGIPPEHDIRALAMRGSYLPLN